MKKKATILLLTAVMTMGTIAPTTTNAAAGKASRANAVCTAECWKYCQKSVGADEGCPKGECRRENCRDKDCPNYSVKCRNKKQNGANKKKPAGKRYGKKNGKGNGICNGTGKGSNKGNRNCNGTGKKLQLGRHC